MSEIYFWFSLLHVAIRTLYMMWSAAAINETAYGILSTIYEIPTAYWCLEVRRGGGLKFFFGNKVSIMFSHYFRNLIDGNSIAKKGMQKKPIVFKVNDKTSLGMEAELILGIS